MRVIEASPMTILSFFSGSFASRIYLFKKYVSLREGTYILSVNTFDN